MSKLFGWQLRIVFKRSIRFFFVILASYSFCSLSEYSNQHKIITQVRLLICGSGSWKILSPIMLMPEIIHASVEVFIYEENQSIQIFLNDIIDSLYSDKGTLCYTNVFNFTPSWCAYFNWHSFMSHSELPSFFGTKLKKKKKICKFCVFSDIIVIRDGYSKEYYNSMDIIVSLTLEAIYESQWIQFNFDNVKNYIRTDGILIPHQTSLKIVPVTTARVYSYLQQLNDHMKYFRKSANGIECYETRAQTIYPMYTRNVYECAGSQELFSFQHIASNLQITSDTRIHKFNFKIDRDCVVTGFSGYYQATLYKNVTLNNRALFRANNRNCIPVMYFPLKSPQNLTANTQLSVTFWFMSNIERKKYWYEWQTTDPIIIGTQNLNGCACFVQKPIPNP